MDGLPAGALGGSSTGAASAGAGEADEQICRNIRIQSLIHSYSSTISLLYVNKIKTTQSKHLRTNFMDFLFLKGVSHIVKHLDPN